jgi:hypothetical protein
MGDTYGNPHRPSSKSVGSFSKFVHRFYDALYDARLASAEREIKRHRPFLHR